MTRPSLPRLRRSCRRVRRTAGPPARRRTERDLHERGLFPDPAAERVGGRPSSTMFPRQRSSTASKILRAARMRRAPWNFWAKPWPSHHCAGHVRQAGPGLVPGTRTVDALIASVPSFPRPARQEVGGWIQTAPAVWPFSSGSALLRMEDACQRGSLERNEMSPDGDPSQDLPPSIRTTIVSWIPGMRPDCGGTAPTDSRVREAFVAEVRFRGGSDLAGPAPTHGCRRSPIRPAPLCVAGFSLFSLPPVPIRRRRSASPQACLEWNYVEYPPGIGPSNLQPAPSPCAHMAQSTQIKSALAGGVRPRSIAARHGIMRSNCIARRLGLEP